MMAKDMENHLELKQKHHMDQLLKAFVTEKKQNERAIQQYQLSNERNAQQIERLEHENKQLKTQIARQEYQRLRKLEDDALKESEAADTKYAWQINQSRPNVKFVWEIHNTSVTPTFHLKSPLYSLLNGYQVEIHIESTHFLDFALSFGLHFGVTRRDFEGSYLDKLLWGLFDWPVKLQVQITVLGKGLLKDYTVVKTTVIQKPENIKDCSTFVSWLDFMSYQDFSKYLVSSPILIEVDVTQIHKRTSQHLIDNHRPWPT